MRRRLLVLSLIFCISAFIPIGAVNSVSYAEEAEGNALCCGTDQELIQELHNELLQRKFSETDDNSNSENDGIQTFLL